MNAILKSVVLAATFTLLFGATIQADVIFSDDINYVNGALPGAVANGIGAFSTNGDVDVVGNQVDPLAAATRAQFGVTSSAADTSFGVLEMDMLRSPGSGASQWFIQVNQGEVRDTGGTTVAGFSYTLGSGATFANGTIVTDLLVQFALYFNTTASTKAYTGPNATSQDLAPGTYDVWVDGTRRTDDGTNRGEGTLTGIDSFFVQTFNNQAGTNARFDNISLTSLSAVPEPSSIAALVLAGGLGLIRRKRLP